MKLSHFEKLITKTGGSVTFSATEREKMRSVLREYIAIKPIRVDQTTVHSWSHVFEVIGSLGQRPGLSFLGVILLITLSSTGLVYATEGTLPGDVLYPIKVNVLEPVHTALLFSNEAKAVWQGQLAERRLEEAAILVTEERLSSTTEARILANFELNASAAVHTSETNSSASKESFSTGFAARLSAHERALQEIDVKKNRESTSALRRSIRAQVSKTTLKSGDEKQSSTTDALFTATTTTSVLPEPSFRIRGPR